MYSHSETELTKMHVFYSHFQIFNNFCMKTFTTFAE